MCNGEQFCKKWKINLLEEEPWSSDHYNTKFTPIFIVSWVESGRAVRDGALVLQFYICLKIKFYPLPCQYHQHQHLATMMVNMPRLGAGAPGENHLSPTSSDSRHNRIGMAAFRFWLQVIESHSSQEQISTKQIQPQLSQTHFRKFHNFKYSRKYQVCNNGNILDKYSIIENTLNFSWTHTNQLRSAVSLKILIWLPSHFKLGGFRRFTFTLNLNYLKIMLLVGWACFGPTNIHYDDTVLLIRAEDDKKER